MPIIIVLLALTVAAWLGAMAATGAQYGLIVGIAAVFVSAVAFLSPKISLLLLVFSMLLSPELGFGAVSASRSVVLRYDDILLVVIFFSWLARTAIFKGKPFITSTPVQRPVLMYTVIAVLSTSFGILRGDIRVEVAMFYVLKYVEYFLLYFMTVNVLESKQEILRYLKYGFWVAVIVTVYAYYYYYNSGPDARATAPFEAAIGDVKSSEPASLGGYYILVFGYLMAMLTEYSGRKLLLAISALALMFPAFMFTFSRSSYIGLAAMAMALVLLSRKRNLMVAGILISVALGMAVVPGMYSKVRDRITMTYSGVYATNQYNVGGAGEIRLEESAAARVGSLRRVFLERLPVHPLLGSGVTGVGIGDTQYALLFGEMGTVGFAAFLWMIYSIISTARRLYLSEDEPWARSLALGLMISTTGLLFQAIGVNTFIIVRIMEPFWFLTAMVMALYLYSEKETQAPS